MVYLAIQLESANFQGFLYLIPNLPTTLHRQLRKLDTVNKPVANQEILKI